MASRHRATGDTVKILNTSLLIILAAGLGGCAVYPEGPSYDNVYNNGYGSTYGNVYSQPPTVIYQQPQPVYVQPRPVYVTPRPIVVEREPYYRYDNRGNRYDDRYRNDNRNDRYDRDDRRPPPQQQARPPQQRPPQAQQQIDKGPGIFRPRPPSANNSPNWPSEPSVNQDNTKN